MPVHKSEELCMIVQDNRMRLRTMTGRASYPVRRKLRIGSASMQARSIASRTFSFEEGYIDPSFRELRCMY